MKKFVSLLLTVALLVTMLTAFAVPAFAAGQSFSYLDRSRDEQKNTVITTNATANATPVTPDMTIWGVKDSDTPQWYAVSGTVTLTVRPEVLGDVRLILCDNAVLNAPKGITLEKDNSLMVYAQSDDTDVMGQLIANSNTGDAGIGGRAGRDGNFSAPNGGKGNSAGTFCQKGGKITVTTETSTCIGGGNGGKGGTAQSSSMSVLAGVGGVGGDTFFYGGITVLTGKTGIGGGKGGNGGAAGLGAAHGKEGGEAKNFIIYAGDITINSGDGVCIGGGNGGDAGSKEDSSGASGGDGNKGGNISFFGGTVKAQSKTFFCFGGGKGGKASMGGENWGSDGRNGFTAEITLKDGLTVYNINDDGTLGSKIESDNISKALNSVNMAIVMPVAQESNTKKVASTLTDGSLTIIVGISAAVVFGLGGFFIGRKNKK